MMKKLMIASLILATLSWPAAARAAETRLTLEECILGALERNLNVAAEVLTPRLSSLAVRRANEKFIPAFTFTYNQNSQNSASYSYIDAADKVTSTYNEYVAQLVQLFPTGGTFTAYLNSYKSDSNRSFQTINPRFGSTLAFEFNQPLLRNFGFTATRREIIVAQNTRDISESQFKKLLMDTIYSVEEAYWNLVYAIENLKVRQQSLALARDLLAKNTRELEVGVIPPIDLVSAKAEVATREADILQAEAEVKNRQDALQTLINRPQENEGEAGSIVPADAPDMEPDAMDLDEAVRLAMENRPDLLSSRLDIKTKDVNLGWARNQLLPKIDLVAQYWSPGISGTQILYQNDDPLTGVIIGTIPGTVTQSLKDAFNFKYKNWSVGLTFTLPLDTVLSHAQYAQARVESDQAVFRLKNLEQQALLEIKTALRSAETDYKRALAYKLARELAEEKLGAEEKKLMAGLSTNYLVLQYQRDLANAQSLEVRALIDYNLSLARRGKALGVTLKDRDIRVKSD